MQNSKCFQNKLTINTISFTIIIIKKDGKFNDSIYSYNYLQHEF